MNEKILGVPVTSFVCQIKNNSMNSGLFLLSFLFIGTLAEVYFKETFDVSWTDRWVESDWKKSDGTAGSWALGTSDWYGDAVADKGIQTTADARFYAISSKMSDKPFSNKDKDLVVQFSVKHPQKIDCGGGYIKILPSSLDQSTFSGESDYAIMFGPDICGPANKKVHVIFNYKGKNLLTKKTIKCESDELTHVYTLIVHPDNTYQVRIDGEEKASGSLFEDWEFLPAKEIKDPSQSKPADWVDDKMIHDPSAVKPEGYDDIPAEIADPEAEMPEDWDEDADGEWEPPMIPNSEFEGEWEAPLIENPDYKGEWVHPLIPNPEYFEDDLVYVRPDMQYVGIELWQVKSGTIFDNIIVTDDVKEADALMKETYLANKDEEKRMFDAIKEEERKEDQRKRDELAAMETDDEEDMEDLFDEDMKDEL